MKKISVTAELEIGVISNLREQVARIAERKRTTIAKLANKMGIKRQYLYAMMNTRSIKKHNLDLILKALGAKAGDLEYET